MVTKVYHLVIADVEVIVFPAYYNEQLHEPVLNLQAVNGKPIATYGKLYVYFNVCL